VHDGGLIYAWGVYKGLIYASSALTLRSEGIGLYLALSTRRLEAPSMDLKIRKRLPTLDDLRRLWDDGPDLPEG